MTNRYGVVDWIGGVVGSEVDEGVGLDVDAAQAIDVSPMHKADKW